jgi:hypothetical protein
MTPPQRDPAGQGPSVSCRLHTFGPGSLSSLKFTVTLRSSNSKFVAQHAPLMMHYFN